MSSPSLHRILYINHTGRVSGAEKILLNILRGLDRTRYEPVVLCPAEGNLQAMVESQGISFLQAPELRARFTWRIDKLVGYLLSFVKVMIATHRQIALVDPDFVHANTLRAGLVATLATMGTKRQIIWHVHDDLPRHPLSSFIRMLVWVSTRTRVVCVSEATARRFSGSLRFDDRLRVIHNGTDLDRFPLKTQGEPRLKDELGLDSSAFLVCAVGQICPRKGLKELLYALDSIRDQAPNVHVAIVGKPVFAHDEIHLKQLISLAADLGLARRVHFTGQRSDISAVLQSADLLVLNSHEEPFGLVLVEAMSSGTPVLATRVGGIPEIITDRESGWLVAKGDTQALAEQLLALSKRPNELDAVARYAHDVVCPRFTNEAFLAKLHVFYARLVSPNSLELPTHVPVRMNTLQDKKGDQHV